MTALLVSLMKMNSNLSEYLYTGIVKPMDYTNQSQEPVVPYENLTTPTFMVLVRYAWESDSVSERESGEKDSNLTSKKSQPSDTENISDMAPEADKDTEISPIKWDSEIRVALSNTTSSDAIPQKVQVGGVLGSLESGRLVVNVNETFAFWFNGQGKLCALLRNMTLVNKLGVVSDEAFAPPLLNMTMDCNEMSKRQDFGQGNWITALYCVRIAAALAMVDFQFQCSDGRESQEQLLLPWFDGLHPAPTRSNPWPYDGDMPTESEACTDRYPLIQVDKMTHAIKKDIQRMVVELVGEKELSETQAELALDQKPPSHPNVQVDDVAIHFRCGDVFGGSMRSDFGVIKYSEYTKWIRNNTRSIGILTQPFEKDLNRRIDSGKVDSCKKAVMLLVEYLAQAYPSSAITIHNGPNETLPLAYARLAMAKQAFTSLSSFGIFPVVGSFGDGYFQRGNRGVNPFATKMPSYLSNLHQLDAPVITTGQIRRAGLTDTLAWLVSEGESNFVESPKEAR